jgi:hypothetical protein
MAEKRCGGTRTRSAARPGPVGFFQAGAGIFLGLGDVAGLEVARIGFVVNEIRKARPVGVALAQPILAEAGQGKPGERGRAGVAAEAVVAVVTAREVTGSS